MLKPGGHCCLLHLLRCPWVSCRVNSQKLTENGPSTLSNSICWYYYYKTYLHIKNNFQTLQQFTIVGPIISVFACSKSPVILFFLFIGTRMVKGQLMSLGHRVQWSRVWESMHRVDGIGVVQRMMRLGCVVRRTYSVPAPLSLLHVDTNHKLIRLVYVVYGKHMLFTTILSHCSSSDETVLELWS